MAKKRLTILVAAFLFILFMAPQACAKKKGMTLLAVSETSNGYTGSLADIYLDIVPGSGNVFVDTFPITKIDTQISMRFAKQIACKYIDADCSKYDFIYTIRATSGIVGGPSAGASAAVLTVSLIRDLELKDGIVITGTINSGGIIGPVGGLKEKIDTAAENGFKKVLVPAGETIEVNNVSVNISDYAKNKSIAIIEVLDLNEAVYIFTGEVLQKERRSLTISSQYEEVMKDIAVSMCGRAEELEKKYLETKPLRELEDDMFEDEESAFESKRKGNSLLNQGKYYSGASMCFSSNIKFRDLMYYLANISDDERAAKGEKLMQALESLEKDLQEKELGTISDLQTYMIVDDRIQDAKRALDTSKMNISNSNYLLAYAEERKHSVLNWLKFFDREGKPFQLDNETLMLACQTKILEANERLQYLRYYFPGMLKDTEDGINNAEIDMSSGKYVLCIFKASKAKAEANVVLGMIGVENSQTKNILSLKISVAEQSIAEQHENGIFPIMAYSYYEYAKSLGEDNKTSSALVYAEYALELSNFDIYFERPGEGEKEPLISRHGIRAIASFVLGVIVGILIMLLIRQKKAPVIIERKAKVKGKKRKRSKRK